MNLIDPLDGNALIHKLIIGFFNFEYHDFEQFYSLLKTASECGMDISLPNQEGKTPLHFACSQLHTKLAATLILLGAKANVVDIFGNTPFDYYLREMNFFSTENPESLSLLYLFLLNGLDLNKISGRILECSQKFLSQTKEEQENFWKNNETIFQKYWEEREYEWFLTESVARSAAVEIKNGDLAQFNRNMRRMFVPTNAFFIG